MEKGYYIITTKIKEGATPIDNIKKFAYYDDDYIEVEEFVEYTPQQIAEQLLEEKEKRERESYKERLENLEAAISFIKSLLEQEVK